ncbi:hypothetical protein FEP28_05583 [Burkholderia multivorans]|nr:hypothetical protein [Burkholderia multivorans]MDR9119269.1 hypothetical protein [Burkholderia multivorans]MDR9158934.1 hypothetical protein [Burkholderia multivorans]MDR9166330.1 hypothetical protein [Burkholderia multivorans]MDR9252950.1 hypothetical protein [Burkholderia multivorans]
MPRLNAVGISGLQAGEDVKTAHVFDHRPEAVSLLNLAALCQLCHNRHDAKMRRDGKKRRHEIESGQLVLQF